MKLATKEEINLIEKTKEMILGFENLRGKFVGDGGKQLLKWYLPWNMDGTMVERWRNFNDFYKFCKYSLGKAWNSGDEILFYKNYVFFIHQGNETFGVAIFLKNSNNIIKIFEGGYGYYGSHPLKYMVEEDNSLNNIIIPKEKLYQKVDEVNSIYQKTKIKIDNKINKLRKKEENNLKKLLKKS
jgi:hypothetical protein